MAETAPAQRSILRVRDFALVWGGGLVSSLGDSINMYALMALMFGMTGRAASPAGLYLDRCSRRNFMIGADLVRAALVLGFIPVGAPWHAYVLYAAVALVAQAYEPARNALLPSVVPPGRLMTANALFLLNLELGRAIGPTLSGYIVANRGTTPVFAIDSATFLVSVVALSLVAERSRGTLGRRGSWRQLSEGLTYAAKDRRIAYTTAVSILAWMVAGASPLMVYAFGRQYLGLSDFGSGALLSALGVGMMAASPFLSGLEARFGRWWLLAWGLLGSGAFTLLMGVFGGFAFSLFCRFALGCAWVVARTAGMALLQEVVPEEFRGRVFAAYNAALTVATIVSLLVIGPLCDASGPRLAVIACGAWFLATGILACALRPAPRQAARRG